MKNGLLHHRSTLEKVIYFIGICLISKLIFTLLSFSLCSFIFNVDLVNINLNEIIYDVNYLRAYKLATVLDQVGTFLIPVLFFAKLISKEPKKIWFFNKIETHYLTLIIPIFFIIITIGHVLLLINHQIDLSFLSAELKKTINENQNNIDQIHDAFIGQSPRSYIVNIFIMAIVPAFCEELVFRGLLQQLFCKWTKNMHIGIALSTLIFALLHFQFYNLFALLFIGFTFGYIAFLFGTIWVTIILHLMFNLFSLTSVYLVKNEMISDNSWDNSTWIFLSVATTLSLGYCYKMLKRENKLAESMKNIEEL